ncbi:murein L,D-transpeptidase [Paracoccus sp. S-4012]|uniref:L,D-transpeptidase family protein n=1 Tax=Paracoccus sp. S-4012 TaxID=2665648 RepID=UPI001E2D84CB|nr:L,D-transpeptidase family protein [Paracoccus sp. S-4012]
MSLGLGVLAAPLQAATAPRLDFTPAEIAFARGVAADPALAAFYGGNDLEPVFTGPEARPRREALLATVTRAADHGLPPARYQPEALRGLLDRDGSDPAAERLMAGIFSAWVHDMSAGLLDPRRVDPAIKRRGEGADAAALLRDFAVATNPAAVLARAIPADRRYLVLQQALSEARGLAAPEGTPPAPEGLWRPVTRAPEVAALRHRLAATGFATDAADPALYDDALADAVRAFQTAAGLPIDGVAGPQTIRRLNAPPGHGPRELLMAMERLRWLPDDLDEGGARHIWVNTPAYTAEIVEEGREVFQTRVVVGTTDPDMQTPEFSDRMLYVVANPTWTVPRSMIVRDYLPRLQANRHAVAHLDVINASGKVIPRDQIDFSRYTAANFPYRLRQKPSDSNALGLVKFLFPNPWNIYLHDTPSKGLFREGRRAFSNGCVRVADPMDLARALLSKQTDDPAGMLARALQSGRERYLTLEPTVPIHLVYFTTLPDADGTIRHYRDVYGRDAALWAALEAALAPPDAASELASAD